MSLYIGTVHSRANLIWSVNTYVNYTWTCFSSLDRSTFFLGGEGWLDVVDACTTAPLLAAFLLLAGEGGGGGVASPSMASRSRMMSASVR